MDLYYTYQSAHCRVVMLTAKALELNIKKIPLKLRNKEHLTPEFIKINPHHTVPTLVDGDVVLWESRAIITYLAEMYDKTNSLYPKDPKISSKINSMLFFDVGTLDARYRDCIKPMKSTAPQSNQEPDSNKLRLLQEALGSLNTSLNGHDFVVGNVITVADHSLVATVSTIDESGINLSDHPNVVSWYNRCKTQMPGYETENGIGARDFGEFVKSKWPQRE